MWILGAQGLRVSSYMPEVIPPEAHLPKKGGGYCWEVFGGNSTYTGRFVVQVVVCIFAINEGIPSGFRQGGASDCRCRGVSISGSEGYDLAGV